MTACSSWAYYWREEHADAIQKFNELVNNFPESPHVFEARYWWLSLTSTTSALSTATSLPVSSCRGQSRSSRSWERR